jgi:hypothetical protein
MRLEPTVKLLMPTSGDGPNELKAYIWVLDISAKERALLKAQLIKDDQLLLPASIDAIVTRWPEMVRQGVRGFTGAPL